MIDILLGEHFVTMSIRLVLALVLSGLIGFEREINKHSAGFRTHILVGVSSTLLMLMSLYGFTDYITEHQDIVNFDPARIPSYVVSGIGFLGAGTIIVNGMTVKGLTTAASIWAVAGLGLVVGIGMYGVAIMTTLIILLSLIFLNNFEQRVTKRGQSAQLTILVNSVQAIEDILKKYNQNGVVIQNINVNTDESDYPIVTTDVTLSKAITKSELVVVLSKLDDVREVYHG
ncbi:methyltransferase [Halolactibacillus miurensis]|uniref:Methyltransferase n=1 Tax=Halolactibacillus miurensis TaxID=306541 RepID=A0A1I6TPL5_9BACI|nr:MULTISPECIES: MgtC/SapB family protein [Halolactibacillus]GEM05563.1 methyltransferase [Halolactibacillus miurensis]SFS91146.1 putative Mg2+ transporter-C (MgtC) family protein [Halolactibacillus miurensis]